MGRKKGGKDGHKVTKTKATSVNNYLPEPELSENCEDSCTGEAF